MEPDDPPRKNYDFKERTFQRDNPLSSGLPPMPTAEELARMAGHAPAQPRLPREARADDPNDVLAVLQHNRAIERKHGQDELEYKAPRKSRRKRDFWLILIFGNLAIVGSVVFARFNPISLIFGLAGLVMLSLGVTWIMWFIMDDY
jgi:hypothetical protein